MLLVFTHAVLVCPAFDQPVVAVSDTTTYAGQITTCGAKTSPRHGRTTGLETETAAKLASPMEDKLM